MPYIDVSVSQKLSDQKKEILKAKLGELIAILPGKSESVLMVAVNDGCSMYFAGQKKENIAYLNVKLYKQSDFEYKSEFTKKVFDFFEKELGVNGDNMFMTFDEYDSWASRGILNNK